MEQRILNTSSLSVIDQRKCGGRWASGSLLGVSYSTGDGGPVWFDSLGGDNTKGDQVWAMDIRLTGFILTGTDTT